MLKSTRKVIVNNPQAPLRFYFLRPDKKRKKLYSPVALNKITDY